MADDKIIPAVSFKAAHTGVSTKSDELGMRPMQAQVYEKRGERYLLIKSPPASGKSRADGRRWSLVLSSGAQFFTAKMAGHLLRSAGTLQ